MLGRSACTFILASILVLMLIHYTIIDGPLKEGFNIGVFNKENKINEIFKMSPFETQYRTFYVGVDDTAQPKMFLNISPDQQLIVSTEDAAKLTFTRDTKSTDLWHVDVYDDHNGKMLHLIDTDAALHTERFEDREFHRDSLGEEGYNYLRHISIEGDRPRDTYPDENTGWTPSWLKDMDATPLIRHQPNTNEGPPIAIKFSEFGTPASFKVSKSGSTTYDILYVNQSTGRTHKMVVLPDKKIHIDYRDAMPHVAFKFFVGSNLKGGVKDVHIWDNYLVAKLSPAPKPGTFITIGERSADYIARAQNIKKTRESNHLNQIIGNYNVEQSEESIPYIFKVTCPPEVIQRYLNTIGVDTKLSSFDEISPPELDGSKVDLNSIDDMDVGRSRGPRAYEHNGSEIGLDSFNSSVVNLEHFEATNKSTSLDPYMLCVKSHLYILEVYDYTGAYIINMDGTTIHADTGEPGPNMEPPLLVSLKNKSWSRIGGKNLL